MRAVNSRNNLGFTLIELIVVVVIFGILTAVAFRSGRQLYDAARVERTKQEMDALAFAVTGNPGLQNNGARLDFGYVGDIGALPPSLDALHANPGGYATWKGPYVENRFSEIVDDFKTDAWGASYAYDGLTISSTGSGGAITRRVAGSVGELLYNRISAGVLDLDGTPPGELYKDSLIVRLTVPDGSGGVLTRSTVPDAGGFFAFDSVAIGNHPLQIIYLPGSDTIAAFVSVSAGSRVTGAYLLSADVWSAADLAGALVKVAGSDSLIADCHGLFFWIENNSGSDFTVDWIRLTWAAPVAFYRYVIWNGTTVFDRNSPKAASGEIVNFSDPQLIAVGQRVRILFDVFRGNPTGGPLVDMDNASLIVELPGGSIFSLTTGACP